MLKPWLVVVALAVPVVAFGADKLLVCYPGNAGDTKAAQPTMDVLAKYLGEKSKLEVSAIYFNAAPPAEKWRDANKPSFGILSLSCYLRWKQAGVPMTVLASSEQRAAATQKFHVLVPSSSEAKALGDLAGKTIQSNHVDDERFVRQVVFDAADTKTVTLKFVRHTLSAIRRWLATDRAPDEVLADAVLIDDDQYDFLKSNLAEVIAGTRVLHSSPELPLAPFVALGEASADARAKMGKALLEMKKDPGAQSVLQQIKSTGFREPELAPLEKAEKAYAR